VTDSPDCYSLSLIQLVQSNRGILEFCGNLMESPLQHLSESDLILFFSLLFCYLMTLSVLRLHSISDKMINECGAAGGMRTGRGNWGTRRKPVPEPLCPPQIPQDLSWNQTWATTVGLPELWHGPILPGWTRFSSCMSSQHFRSLSSISVCYLIQNTNTFVSTLSHKMILYIQINYKLSSCSSYNCYTHSVQFCT
jgi:hypothetical protein